MNFWHVVIIAIVSFFVLLSEKDYMLKVAEEKTEGRPMFNAKKNFKFEPFLLQG